MNAKLHRRVVVIKDQNAIQARPLGARLGLGDDRRARPGPVRTAVVLGHADGKERAAIADCPVVEVKGFCGMILRSMIPGLQRHARAGVTFNMAPDLPRRKPTGNPYPTRNTKEIHTFRAASSSHRAPSPSRLIRLR